MFSLDDRTGNVVTTTALFMAAGAILYLARGVFLVLLLSLFFSYLLEPAVTFLQEHSWLGKKSRSWAIAEVYVIGIVVIGSVLYKFGPLLAAQLKSLRNALPLILEDLSSGKPPAGLGISHSLSATQQLRIESLLASHQDLIAHAFERGAAAAAYVAASAVWLLPIPILAIFILRDGRQMAAAIIDAAEERVGQSLSKRILLQVDTMLAEFIRAQLALSGLSFVFYSVAMLVLRFPYAIALGLLGGVLEFLPAVGWIVAALTILTVGYLTHAHWIWMAGLLVVWRLLQDYVNSPRIMGKTLQLQPLTVVIALMMGGEVGGIAGLYLAVPIVAALRIVWLECFPARNSPNALPNQK